MHSLVVQRPKFTEYCYLFCTNSNFFPVNLHLNLFQKSAKKTLKVYMQTKFLNISNLKSIHRRLWSSIKQKNCKFNLFSIQLHHNDFFPLPNSVTSKFSSSAIQSLITTRLSMRTSTTRQKHLALSESLYSKSIMYKCQRKLILKQAITKMFEIMTS